MTEREYRNQVLDHLVSTAGVLEANVTLQGEDSKPQVALSNFLNLIQDLAETMKEVNSDEGFVAVTKGLEMVMKKEFFDQVSQSRQPQKKQAEPKPQPKAQKAKPEIKVAAIDIGSHLAVDPATLPKAVLETIADELKRMGLPADDVDAFFQL